MKRSDLPTTRVLVGIRDHGTHALDELTGTYPIKVVRAAFARDVRRGYIEYGVTLDRPWLTPQGHKALGL
ncbi:hypothetical protein ACIGBH_27420 [Streptomyces sp. NPDC085929]|uniref:hypothetical protein n=1 Tax=Streptomyces sp. NPDC085929 TaxID=3365739 RepID=UPI0037D7C4DC